MECQLVAPVESLESLAVVAVPPYIVGHVMPSINYRRPGGKGDGDSDGDASLCLNLRQVLVYKVGTLGRWTVKSSRNCLVGRPTRGAGATECDQMRQTICAILGSCDSVGSPGYTLNNNYECITEETRTIPSLPGFLTKTSRLFGPFRLLVSWKRRALECLGDMKCVFRCWSPITSV